MMRVLFIALYWVARLIPWFVVGVIIGLVVFGLYSALGATLDPVIQFRDNDPMSAAYEVQGNDPATGAWYTVASDSTGEACDPPRPNRCQILVPDRQLNYRVRAIRLDGSDTTWAYPPDLTVVCGDFPVGASVGDSFQFLPGPATCLP